MKKLTIIITVIALLFAGCKNKQTGQDDYAHEDQPDLFFENDTATYNPQTGYQNNSSSEDVFELPTENLNQDLASEGQKVIFSFKTKDGKTLSLLTDQNDSYLIYRYGTPTNIELQYPREVTPESWKLFKFEGYKTPSLHLMHVMFDNGGTKYIVYYNKFVRTPEDNKIGVQVVTGKTRIDIRGKMNTLKGSLEYFRHNDKILKTW